MTQSKDENTVTLTLGDFMEDEDNTVTISLEELKNNTSPTYWAGDSVTDVIYTDSNDGTFTISTGSDETVSIGDWNLTGNFGAIDNKIDPYRVERMIEHYPALEKVWVNFKNVYDMVLQDYEGKVKAGEVDDSDDIPF
jgi:hypothetical protein